MCYRSVLRGCLVLYVLLTSQFSLAESDDVVLGMSGAFSGASASLGNQLLDGMETWFDRVNESGGVNGRKIRVLAYDDAYNPGPAMQNTIELVDVEKVFALIGYVGTPTVTRVVPLLSKHQREHLYLFSPLTGSEIVRQGHYSEQVFNLRASYRQETAALVDKLVAADRKRIAIFYQADAYGRSGWDGVRRALRAQGLNIVGEATYRRGTDYDADYSAQVDILQKQKPDAVVSIASYAAAAGLIRDARNVGWNVPIANVSFANSVAILALLTEESLGSGAGLTKNLIFTEVVPNFNRSSLPAVEEYRTLSEANDLALSFVGFEGFLNAKLMAEVLTRMGAELSRSKIPAIMANMQNFDLGIDERISFQEGSNQGLQRVYFNTVEAAELVPIESWRRWRRSDVEAL